MLSEILPSIGGRASILLGETSACGGQVRDLTSKEPMASNLATSKLGNTDMTVSKLGFGAYELRGLPTGRDISFSQADSILNTALDAGINFIDTSIDYGMSESYIGRSISSRRSEYFLASKCGCVVGGEDRPAGTPYPHEFSRENIVGGVENSLRLLETDYLDVVQFHWSPSRETLEDNESVDALLELQSQGKIRYIGMSGTLPNLPDQIEMGVFDVFQIPYSALYRKHELLISQVAEVGGGTVIRGGVAKGDPEFSGAPDSSAWSLFERAKLHELLDDGVLPTEFMLRFTLSHPGLHTTIVGTANIGHLAENIKTSMKGPLPQDVYAEVKRRLRSLGEEP